jgi:hypothetical protein
MGRDREGKKSSYRGRDRVGEKESEKERNGSEREEKSSRKTRCHWSVITWRQADSDRLTLARTGPTVVYTGSTAV